MQMEPIKQIRWGIIGCGDVTEKKSGPAFQLVPGSSLVAVMRRNAALARDYAERHHVEKWYDDAGRLIDDPAVNAIYVATPPSSHEEYVTRAVRAGKPVYVEKPMSVDSASAGRMSQAARQAGVRLCVAHYRRAQPYFQAIKKILDDQVLGTIRTIRLDLFKKMYSPGELALPGNRWRVDPAISGGGIFHDLAPHQLDILYYFFGEVSRATGIATNQAGKYAGADHVSGSILFKNGIVCTGCWCFNVREQDEVDLCTITGTGGTLSFSFFSDQVFTIHAGEREETSRFIPPVHVQQPLIEKVVQYFRGEAPNPCSGEDGVAVMEMIDAIATL